jgi:serine/threonine-protein kinase
MLPWVAAALVLGVVIAGAVLWNLRAPESRQIIRFDFELPEGQEFNSDWPISISPDGKKIVYSTPEGLYLRSVDELTSKPISGTDGFAVEPFFSPDGKWIGYFSYNDRKLKKISVNGGAPVTLCGIAGTGMGKASWGADDWIVYSAYPNEIMRIRADGGTPEALAKSPDMLIAPQILPDGKALMYATHKAGGVDPRIMVKPLKSGEPKELLPGWLLRYLPSGHIIHMPPDAGTLFAVPFDANKLELVGEPLPMVEGATSAAAAISNSGTLVYRPITPTAAEPGVTLVWVNRVGKEEALGTPQNTYAFPKVSPDGTRVALSIGSFPDLDIWIWDIARKTLSKLTFEKTRDMTPIWSPDSRRIAYWADTAAASPNGIYWKAADGTGEAEKLISAPDGRQFHLFSWSSDRKALLMQDMVTWTNMDLCMLSMEGVHKKTALLQTQYSEAQPKISPDGRWIAYGSDETTGEFQRSEIYVRPFPDVNKGKWQVSTGAGSCPLWSPDMRELFYLSADNSVMAVAVESKPTLSFGTPRMLFKSPYLGLTMGSGHPWDIHPDGKRFLMMKPPDSASKEKGPRPKMVIVTNWMEELKQRVPAK